jgi:hypothetical protein
MRIIKPRQQCISGSIDPSDRTIFRDQSNDFLLLSYRLHEPIPDSYSLCDRLSGIHGDDMCVDDDEIRRSIALCLTP